MNAPRAYKGFISCHSNGIRGSVMLFFLLSRDFCFRFISARCIVLFVASLTTTTTMHCYCSLTACSINSTDSEFIQEKLVKIQNAMFIDKSQLSSAIRKRTSASDPRPSSKYIGLCGGIVIGIILLLIVLADIPLINVF